MRYVAWDRPIPIALSRFARTWIRIARHRPLPPDIAEQVFGERLAALVAFAESPELLQLLHAREGRDSLSSLPGDIAAPAIAFEQMHADPDLPDWPPRLVPGGRVTLHLTPDGLAIRAITSSFQPDLEPPLPMVSEQEAIDTALAAAREAGYVDPLADGAATPLVSRNGAPLAGARPRTEVRRAADRLLYRVRVHDEVQPNLAGLEALVDAATGELRELSPLSSHTSGVFVDNPQLTHFIALKPARLLGFVEGILCFLNDGVGLDLDGQQRSFSTTLLSTDEAQDDPARPYALSSCNESGARFFLREQDLITFRVNPEGAGGFYVGQPFRDDDNQWTTPAADIRHANASQFWGERVLKSFKTRGYGHRLHTNVTPDPVFNDPNDWRYEELPRARFLAWYAASDTTWAGKVETKYQPSNPSPSNKFLAPDSLIVFGGPKAPFRTMVDASTAAHEFAHSFTYDLVVGTGGASNPMFSGGTEAHSVDEGMADCLAMLVLSDHIPELGPRYAQNGQDAPFHLGAALYTDPAFSDRGWPNLESPDASFSAPLYPDEYKYWAGARTGDSELNSTLVGGACKLLITGGGQPTIPDSETELPQSALSLSASTPANRALAYERLWSLILYTYAQAKSVGLKHTFHDLIDILATNATLQGWGIPLDWEHIVRRAFDQYGFGRGIEDEPNDWNDIESAANGQRNLVAAALGWARPISGELCSSPSARDDDFFVINERVRKGDKVDFATDSLLPPESFDVRFWLGNPCDYDEPATGDPANLKKGCALAHQVFPQADAQGFTPDSSTAGSAVFTIPEISGGCEPGGCPNYRVLYMGIRLKEGPCDAKYTLSAQIIRAPGNEIY